MNMLKKASVLSIMLFALTLGLSETATAQRSYIRSKIRNDIERDQANKQRERGKEEIKKVSYENDTRYVDPKNRVEATIEMEMKTFNKKGEVEKTPIKSILVFGKTGECMVMNHATKEEMWMLFDYEKKANYMVNIQSKTATKMPLINMKKMVGRMAKNQEIKEDESGKWELTNEKKNINGYNCQKYVYTDKDGTKMDSWVTKDISIDISENYLLGSRIKDYGSSKPANSGKVYPNGMLVRSIMYDKKTGQPTSQTDVLSFKKSSDPKYFNLVGFKVNDVLDGL